MGKNLEKLKRSKRSTYYISLDDSLLEKWEQARTKRGLEKTYMVTKAFMGYLNELGENDSSSEEPA